MVICTTRIVTSFSREQCQMCMKSKSEPCLHPSTLGKTEQYWQRTREPDLLLSIRTMKREKWSDRTIEYEQDMGATVGQENGHFSWVWGKLDTININYWWQGAETCINLLWALQEKNIKRMGQVEKRERKEGWVRDDCSKVGE